MFTEAGFEWRGAGCSMCLGDEPRQARRPPGLRVVVEPQLQGTPGQPDRPHAADEPGDGGRGGRSPARSSTCAQMLEEVHAHEPSTISAWPSKLIAVSRALRAAAATTSTPIASCRRDSCVSSHSKASNGTCSRTIARGRSAHPFNDPRYAGASILVVNGELRLRIVATRTRRPSWRAHGVRAVVGESFSEISPGATRPSSVMPVLRRRSSRDRIERPGRPRSRCPITFAVERQRVRHWRHLRRRARAFQRGRCRPPCAMPSSPASGIQPQCSSVRLRGRSTRSHDRLPHISGF